MRLLRLELENYIGIYNGSGLHKLVIDFSKCINKITVIRGANGSGKSSLFKTIHPFSDSNYYLIPGLDARKRIVYQVDMSTIIDIIYEYPDSKKGDGTRKPTTCEVYLNGVDINSSKNVTSGRDVICDILDIDSGFLTLGQLSSEDRGLVDKKPSERKKFINTKLSELDAYNNIYKKIMKKSVELKGMVDSLSNDINNIGDIQSIQSNIYLWEGQLEKLEEDKLVMIRDMTEMNIRMDDIFSSDEDPETKNTNMQKELNELDSKMELYKDCIDYNEEEYNKLTLHFNELEAEIKRKTEDQTKLSNELTDINSNITDIKNRICAIGDISLLDKYKTRIDELKSIKSDFEKMCEEHGFLRYNDITIDEYDYNINAYRMISNLENSIKISYSDGEIEEAMNVFSGVEELENENELQRAINDMTDNLNDLSQLINHNNFYKEQSKGINNIPKGCVYKSECPFVKNIVEASRKLLTEEEERDVLNHISEYSSDIKNAKERLQTIRNINKCLSSITNLYNLESASKNTLLKFCKNMPKDVNNEMDMIKCSILGKSWFDFDWDYYYDLSNSFIVYKSYQTDIDKLEEQYKSLSKNEELLTYMNKQLQDNMNKKTKIDGEMFILTAHLNEIKNERDNLVLYLNEYKIKLNRKSEISELEARRNQLVEELSQFYIKYNKYKTLNENFESIKNQMTIIDRDQIPSLKNKISDAKYKLVIYNDYVSKHNKYSKEYEKIEVIKYCCSPTTGIQTVYAEMYMNKILGISNQLLSMFFGGEFVMQPFIINDKEFRMPIMGSGVLNDDISSMSTSQKCIISMIISFALLSNASSIYKIIKIDEIDSPLDTINRSAFFHALDTLMNYLNFDQCIMISHNIELNMANTDIILLRNDDHDLKIDGNIIFNLEDER